MTIKAATTFTTLTATLLASFFLTTEAANAQPAAPDHQRGGMHHRMERGNPEHMSQRHLDHMAKAADATPEQKTKLAAIAKAAEADIKPLHDQLRANHERGAALYTAPTIDRAAVEQHRAEQSNIMEQISRRRSQSRLDSAEVLSPEQRAKLAAMLKKSYASSKRYGMHDAK